MSQKSSHLGPMCGPTCTNPRCSDGMEMFRGDHERPCTHCEERAWVRYERELEQAKTKREVKP